ncbi:hypothetical protein GT037_010495, partial [Alternaria burnsii]
MLARWVTVKVARDPRSDRQPLGGDRSPVPPNKDRGLLPLVPCAAAAVAVRTANACQESIDGPDANGK